MHQSVVENVTRITNIMKSDLACIFPEYMIMFPDIGSRTSLALLQKFTTPAGMVKSGIDSVLKVMQKSSRNHYKREDAQKLMDLAKDSVGMVVEALAMGSVLLLGSRRMTWGYSIYAVMTSAALVYTLAVDHIGNNEKI